MCINSKRAVKHALLWHMHVFPRLGSRAVNTTEWAHKMSNWWGARDMYGPTGFWIELRFWYSSKDRFISVYPIQTFRFDQSYVHCITKYPASRPKYLCFFYVQVYTLYAPSDLVCSIISWMLHRNIVHPPPKYLPILHPQVSHMNFVPTETCV